MIRAAAIATVFAAVPPACAQAPAAPPPLRPTRDVTVTYKLDGPAADLIPGGNHGPWQVAWDAAGQRLRAEPTGQTQVLLVDLAQKKAQLMDTALRVVLPITISAKDLGAFQLEPGQLARRNTTATIAGLTCAEYDVIIEQGRDQVCLTRDGVPLRGSITAKGKPGRFTAQAVTYGPVPAARFVPPPGTMALPAQGVGATAGTLDAVGGLVDKLGGPANAAGALQGLLGRLAK